MTKYGGDFGFLKQNAATGVATGTYNTVLQILDMGPIGAERAGIDVSAHGDLWVDEIPGRFNGNEVELTVAWDPTVTTHQNFKTDFDTVTPAARYYEHQHPSWASAYRFPAICRKWDVESTNDGAMEGHITLKIVNPGVTTVTPS